MFTFPDGCPRTDNDYDYAFCYFLVVGWEFCLSIAAFVIMIKRSRTKTIKKAVPLIFMGALICYTVLYYSGFEWLRTLAGDITVSLCCLFTLTFESCIRSGLIVYFDDIIRTYEILEKIIENSLESIYSLWLKVRSDDESIEPYEYNDRSCAITMTMDNFNKLIDGKLDPVAAFTFRKLKVDGDIGKALEFAKLIKQ